MKLLLIILSFFSLWLALSINSLADEGHPEGTPHTEEAVTIDPVIFIGIVIFLVIGGFIIWQFVLRTKRSSSTKPS